MREFSARKVERAKVASKVHRLGNRGVWVRGGGTRLCWTPSLPSLAITT